MSATVNPVGDYIHDWRVIGPLPRIETDADLAALNNLYEQIGNDKEPTLSDGVKRKWKDIHVPGPVLDFSPYLTPDARSSAVVCAQIFCDTDINLRLTCAADCAYAISSNGRVSRITDVPRRFRFDSTVMGFECKAGLNTLTLVLTPKRGRSKGLLALRTDDFAPANTKTFPVTSAMLNAPEARGAFFRPNRVLIREGDDPSWANPALDDHDWELEYYPGIPESKYDSVTSPTTFWYRFNAVVDEELLGRPIILECYPYLTTLEIFVDGKKVEGPCHMAAPWRDVPIPMTFEKTVTPVALRWRVTPAILKHQTYGTGDFAILVRDYNNALEDYNVGFGVESRYELHRYALMAYFAATLLFHLVLYYSHRRRRENLFVALTMAVALLSVLALHVSDITEDRIVWFYVYKFGFLGLSTLCIALSVGLLQVAVAGRFSRWFYLYLGIGGLCLVAGITLDSNYAKLFPILCAPEGIRILYEAIAARRFGKRRLVLVSILLFIIVGLTSMGSITDWPESTGFMRYASWYGFAIFTQMVLVLMAREFGLSIAKVEQFTVTLENLVAQRTRELGDEIEVRKKAESDLSQSLAVLHATITTTVGGIAVLDGDRNVILCNSKLAELWGIEETWPGMPSHEDRLNLFANQAASPDAARRLLDAIFTVSDKSQTEQMTLADGRILVVSGHPYRFEGRVTGRLFVCQDDTERLQREAARDKLVRELQEALAEVRTLHGLLPICASCKRIRDDFGYWSQIEHYVSKHTQLQFSHGICPECMKKLYPQFAHDNPDDEICKCT